MSKTSNIHFMFTKDIKKFGPLFHGLLKNFGYPFWATILTWCGVIGDASSDTRYWRVWLIRKNEETIGICGLYSLNQVNTSMWLGWFGILPKFRNMKIGTLVLKHLEYKAKHAGCKELYSYVDCKNRKALRFYKRNGFEIIGNVQTYCEENRISKKMMKEEFERGTDLVIVKQL